MKRILLVHQNFPGQFKHIGAALATRQDCQVLGLGANSQIQGRVFTPGLNVLSYLERTPGANDGRHTHRYLREHERAVRRGQDVARALIQLRRDGYRPDVVMAHPGWGESLFVKDIFPRTKLINYFEYFYSADDGDAGFDPEFPMTEDDRLRLRIKSNTQLQALVGCDQGISPTRWQRSRYPRQFHDFIEVLHEGLDFQKLRPDPQAQFVLPNGRVLSRSDCVLTYVARNLEPYRGFHVLMRALPELLKREPGLQVVIVGGTGVSYGAAAPKPHASHLEWLIAETGQPDPQRVHIMDRLSYDRYLQLLQVSSVHLYLTYPFVLSWSMLEALACGCAVLASDTAPVQEFIEDGVNGKLFSFFDREAMLDGISELLQRDTTKMREQARCSIEGRIDFQKDIRPRVEQLLGFA